MKGQVAAYSTQMSYANAHFVNTTMNIYKHTHTYVYVNFREIHAFWSLNGKENSKMHK